ncbi:hypothetical protein [Rubritalea tangerina]|uniref:Roadblock/LAMTOR2 domain-containing protein n=1 Tax=Rubritalea tangerina TaxID=430798 RepID=A0ABW4ZDS0_9BACT
MDSINPWLDVEELNRLAKALMEPVSESSKREDKVEASSVARSTAGKVLAQASALAKKAGILAQTKEEVRHALLPELGEWLYNNAKCRGLCVVDRDGDVLHAAMPNPEWTQLAISAATERNLSAAAQVPNIRIRVTANSYMQFIRVQTARGPLLVGLFTRNLLKDSQFDEFSRLVEKISGAEQVEKR